MSTRGIFSSVDRNPRWIQPSFAQSIAQYSPRGNAPLLAMLGMIAPGQTLTDTTLRQQFRNFVHPYMTLLQAVPAGQKDGNAILSVQIGSGIPHENDVYQNFDTGEQVLIIGVNGDSQIVVRRGQGGMPLPMASGARLIRVGTAFEEASLRPSAQSAEGYDELDNCTQIFRNGHARTGTTRALMTKVLANDASIKDHMVGGSRQEMSANHARDMETSILFGRRHVSQLHGMPLRFMSGVIELIERYAPQNICSAPNGTLSYNQFEELIDPIFDEVTDPMEMNDRILFGGTHITRMVNRLGRAYASDRVLLNTETSNFGMSYTTFETDRGKFKVIEHPLWNHFAKLSPSLATRALILDLSSLSRHYLPGRDGAISAWNGNGTTPSDGGVDAEGETILTEMTISTSQPRANGMLLNWCDVSKDVYQDATPAQRACFSISKPWGQGYVAAGEHITINVSGAVPSVNLSIMTPTGVQTMTVNASGVGVIDYVIPTQTDLLYEFSLVMTDAANQRFWNDIAAVAKRATTALSGQYPYIAEMTPATVGDSLAPCDADGKLTATGPIVC